MKELPERRGLAHNDCLELAYYWIYPDGYPSELIAFTGLTLMATRKKIAYTSPILTVIPRRAPETWGLTHNNYSESIYNKI